MRLRLRLRLRLIVFNHRRQSFRDLRSGDVALIFDNLVNQLEFRFIKIIRHQNAVFINRQRIQAKQFVFEIIKKAFLFRRHHIFFARPDSVRARSRPLAVAVLWLYRQNSLFGNRVSPLKIFAASSFPLQSDGHGDFKQRLRPYNRIRIFIHNLAITRLRAFKPPFLLVDRKACSNIGMLKLCSPRCPALDQRLSTSVRKSLRRIAAADKRLSGAFGALCAGSRGRASRFAHFRIRRFSASRGTPRDACGKNVSQS